MTTRAAQRRLRNKNSVDVPRVGVFQVSESTRMFGDNTLDDSENSSSLPSLSGVQVRGKSSKAGAMESIISGDGSCDSENFTKVASGENTAQGVKKEITEESKNGNPFMDGSSHSNTNNRVGPFETGDQDFMVDETDDGDDDMDVIELVMEEIQDRGHSNPFHSNLSSSKSDRSSGSRGVLGMVDSTKDTYDGGVNPAGSNKKGYYNLSQIEDRKSFMANMNGVGGRIPGEQIYSNDEEDETQDSPLFREDSVQLKTRNSIMSMGLSKDNPFADEDDSLTRIETHKPRSNGLEGSRYASMRELLDEENASPFTTNKRKGMGGCIDKTFGEKKTKRRKITAVSIILLICGGIGAALYVILGMKPADSSELDGSELIVVPILPTQSPSRENSPVGPSFMLPSSVLNGSTSDFDSIQLPPTFINGSNSTGNGSFATRPTWDGTANSTYAPSMGPGNESSNNSSITLPTISPALNESSSPTIYANSSVAPTHSSSPTINADSSFVPTPEPSIFSEINATTNETVIDPNATNTDFLANETVSVFPTPAQIGPNSSETIMPSVVAIEANETESVSPTPAPFSTNVSDSLMPSTNSNETSNVTESMSTPSPSIINALDSLMPSVIVKNETESTAVASIAPSTAPINSLLDELSDLWSRSMSIQHSESSALFGTSVAMSADPVLLIVGAKDALNEAGDAAGAVYVYSLDANGTASMLQVLYGENANDEFGNAVSVSDDGSRLVVGSRSEVDQSGAVRIYTRSESLYSQLGSTIIGTFESGRAGWAVSISGDGSTIAVGSPRGGTESGGSVRTYQYDGDLWFLYGSEIEGGADAAVGYSVSLSSDGGILAVGNPKATNRDGSLNAGKVATYTLVESEWALVAEVFGQSSEDVEGTSIALSPDGEFLVTGAKGQNGEDGSMSSGSCSLYQNASGRRWRWRNSLLGRSVDERLGTWVSISRDSSVFACGGVAAARDGLGTSGVVRAWNRRTSLEAEIWPRSKDADASSFGSALAFSPLGLAVGAPDYSGGDGGNLAGAVEIFEVE